MQCKLIWEIMKKDWADAFRSKQIFLGILLFPILMGLILPAFLIGSIAVIPFESESGSEFDFLDAILPPLTFDWNMFSDKAKTMYFMVILSHLFLLFIPVFIPSTIASDTIVGEKERDTIEGLLSLPVTDGEILLAKILSSMIPSLIVTWLVSLPYVLLIDFFMFPEIGRFLLPDLGFLLLITLLAPLISFISVTATVMISSRVSTARDAQQLSVIFVFPLMGVIIGQLFTILLDLRMTLIGCAVLALISVGAFKIATLIFDRDKLMAKI